MVPPQFEIETAYYNAGGVESHLDDLGFAILAALRERLLSHAKAQSEILLAILATLREPFSRQYARQREDEDSACGMVHGDYRTT
jgi:hypothetical protein